MTKQKFSAIILAVLFAGAAHAADITPTEQDQDALAITARGSHAIAYPAGEDGSSVLMARMNVRTVAKAVAGSAEPLKVDITARNAADLNRVEKWFAGELAKTEHIPVRVQGWVQPDTEDLKIDVRLAQKSDS